MLRAFPRLILLLAAVALLITACGDDGGSPFTSAGEATETTADDGSAGTTGPGDDGTNGTAGGDDELSEVLARYREVPLRTTYLTGEGTSQVEMTFSQDPTLDPPVSAIITPDLKMIFFPARMIFCSGAGAAVTCLEMPAEEGTDFIGAMLSPYAMLAMANEDLSDIPGYEVETEEVTIAGRRGICFTFRPQAALAGQTEFVRQCVDDELGFTLLLEAKEVGDAAPERVLELTAMGDPQPGDFQPTGPVTPMPTG